MVNENPPGPFPCFDLHSHVCISWPLERGPA
jgi:hypothetical protein